MIQFFLAEDLANPCTGEVVATIGQLLTESLVLQLNQYGISRYEVTIWKPAENWDDIPFEAEDLPFDEDQTPLVINDPSLNLDPPDLSLLDTDDLIFDELSL